MKQRELPPKKLKEKKQRELLQSKSLKELNKRELLLKKQQDWKQRGLLRKKNKKESEKKNKQELKLSKK